MAETTEKTGEKKLSVTPTKTLTLKGRSVEQGVVRQSFSHGRTKAVVVEKVKSRVHGKPRAEGPPPARPPATAPPPPRPRLPPPHRPQPRLHSRLLRCAEAIRCRAAHPDRGGAHRPRARARRRPAARGRRAQDCRRGSAHSEGARRDRARRARGRRGAQGRRGKAPEASTLETKRKADEVPRSTSAERHDHDDGGAGNARPEAAGPASGARSRGGRSAASSPRRRRPALGPHVRLPAAKPARPTAGEAPRPSHARHRAHHRRGPRALGRVVPPPHAAADGSSRRQRHQGQAGPRGDDPGIHHHPGARQPHGRAGAGGDRTADEARADAQDHRHDRRRHRPDHRRGDGPQRQARGRVRRRGRAVRQGGRGRIAWCRGRRS